MAVDTRSKRASMLQFGRPWVCMLPFPDGTIDQGDRQHFLRLYSGILAVVSITVFSVGPQLRVAGLRLPVTRSTPVLLPETRATARLLPRIDDTEEL